MIQGNDNRAEFGSDDRRVLLVEDDREVRELMASVLRDEGWKVVEMTDGMEALNYLGGARVFVDEVPAPDLVVADIVMPNFSGLDLLVGLREHEVYPPVLMVTGVGDEDVRREARRLGASRVVTKPFGVEDFVEAVDEVGAETPDPRSGPPLEPASPTVDLDH